MSLTRREFLRGIGGILAAGVAPAFIGANVLMPVKRLLLPTTAILWGDGAHDDAPALNAFMRGERVMRATGEVFDGYFAAGTMRLESTVTLAGPGRLAIYDSDINGPANPMFYVPPDAKFNCAIENNCLWGAA